LFTQSQRAGREPVAPSRLAFVSHVPDRAPAVRVDAVVAELAQVH
jgi:hypothetical protein